MRLAYLITAYDQPAQLRRLVDALDEGDVTFYIHIDAHIDIAPFVQAVGTRQNVQFVSKRIPVQWMGFTQVESILQLMTEAATAGFDYCALLSGSDYPIKSNTQIRSFYESAAEEFITFWRLADRPSWRHKIEYFYPIDLVPIHGYSKNIESVYWRRLFWGRFHKYRRLMPKRAFPFPMTPYGGSDWWSLSGPCVEYVLRFVRDNPAFSRFYRYTHCPSEMFFHTIVMNSPFARRARMFAEYQEWSARASASDKALETVMLREDAFNLRYIDWSGQKSGAREAPAVLDERDWERLEKSPALFARKFDARRSASLLDRIDRGLRERHECALGSMIS
jgi:hypothetical protein